MTPTNKFRWIKRKIPISEHIPCALPLEKRFEVVLQQWFEGWGNDVIDGVNGSWRDVPVETEQ